MSRVHVSVRWGVLLLAAIPFLVGCPGGQTSLVIQVNPTELDFGNSETELSFNVTKSGSSQPLPPVKVSSNASWVQILNCTSVEDGCVSSGPTNPVTINVRADRSQMVVGQNSALITVSAQGVVGKTVTVRATTQVVVDFSVNNRTPFTGDAVVFTATAATAAGWQVPDSGWSWGFGNGSSPSTSNLQNPPPVTYSSGGESTPVLTVTATNGTEELILETRKENYIIVSAKTGPVASFTASTTAPAVNNPVFFTDTSTAGTAPIESWSWDFGDESTSELQNPFHAYTTDGSFSVTLRVESAHGTGLEFSVNFIKVVVRAPVADFTADVTDPPVGTVVRFTDTSVPGSVPITDWDWNFGDNGTDARQNPIHVYTEPGEFNVRLTVSTSLVESSTETKTGFITARLVPPVADFTASTRRPLLGLDTVQVVQFNDISEPGTSPIVDGGWEWDFGDGTMIVEQNPVHTYEESGFFTVSLSVTSDIGMDVDEREAYIFVSEATALDEYVLSEDTTFGFSETNTISETAYTAHIVNLVSQTWRTEADFDFDEAMANPEQSVWEHWMVVIEPDEVLHDTALLVVTGGDTNEGAPTRADPTLANLAIRTNSVVVQLMQVPNQPLLFSGESFARSGDSLLAFTFDRYLTSLVEGPEVEEDWPALLPMVKSVAAGMDATEKLLAGLSQSEPVDINTFIVRGTGSVQGWAAWLSMAVDERVIGAAPGASHFLNMVAQREHHEQAYGFLSEAVFDYVESRVFSRLGSLEEPSPLLAIVDPAAYNGRYASTSTLVISSPGDQFFPLDSTQFYFNGLLGAKKLGQLPNTDRLLDDEAALAAVFVPWYESILGGETLPQFGWSMESFIGFDRIVVSPEAPPSAARVWLTTSRNRDFRFDSLLNQLSPRQWISTPLTPDSEGQIVADVPNNFDNTWTGFFVELDFERTSEIGETLDPYRFSTEVRVAPADVFPEAVFDLPQAVILVSSRVVTVGQTLTFFDISTAGSGPIIRWNWDFGDGTTLREAYPSVVSEPSHTYTVTGNFMVTLTVTTAHGSSEVMDTVTVLEGPAVSGKVSGR